MQNILYQTFLTACLFATGLLSGQASSITGLTAEGYDHHVEIRWDQIQDPGITGVRVYQSVDGTDYTAVASYGTATTTHIGFLGDWDKTGSYYLRSLRSGGRLDSPSDTVSATTFEMSDSMLLDMVQEYTFRYFYDFGHPVSGLARERNTTSTVTSGGSGFGIMAIIVGVERGFITYEEGLARTTKIVDFLMDVPRFRGAFSHWMNGATGDVIPFSARDNGGDLVETAFLIQGLLTARQYYLEGGSEADRLRDNITQLWEEVNWNWYRRGTRNVLTWHWSPDQGFAIDLPIIGFNEAQIIYLLAIAAPDPALDIPASLYHSGWAGGNYTSSSSFYDVPLIVGRGKGGPLFFTHYSNIGWDPRGMRDRYANYFERNRNQTLINYLHCVDNPFNREGYSENVWGLTASDDPDGYKAHSPNGPNEDNGTITPTAALSSMPYTPVESMRALKHFYREMGDRTWGQYGFYDAFNEGRNWYADSYLAIDQGPIICMIENHRSGLLWDLFMRNPEIQPALDEMGFVADTMTTSLEIPAVFASAPTVYPNPVTTDLQLKLALHRALPVRIQLLDAALRTVQEWTLPESTDHQPSLQFSPNLSPGYYLLKLTTPEGSTTLPVIRK